jgi:hypothetical protein
LHLLPTLWFRNDWSWEGKTVKPSLKKEGAAVKASHPLLGDRYFYHDGKRSAAVHRE